MGGSPQRSNARRRKSRRAKTRKQNVHAPRWWKRPAALPFLVTALLALVGLGLVVRAIDRIPVEGATLGGLSMKLVEARWLLDQMDHGENFQKPSTMMPDMPEWGKQRVTLDLSFQNVSSQQQIFDGLEFSLMPEIGEEAPPTAAQTGRAQLAPGQILNTVIHFDFDTTRPHGKLRVAWRRADETIYLAIPAPAEHYHLRPRGGGISLPSDARLLLPIGKADRGRNLFIGVYGCVACHGDPDIPGSANVGPHLANIGRTGFDRIEGKTAAQYIYDSIMDPNRFIAPECQNGQPCSNPTAMPEYASLLSLEDAADLLAYLLAQTQSQP